MNVIFISPHFPPNYYLFPVRLRQQEAKVLGIGDVPWEGLRAELKAAMADYVYVPDMNHYDAMLRAVGFLTWRHGKIDRLDSNTEHWLPTEALLRRDFNIWGQKPADLEVNRSKLAMKDVFRKVGIACGAGQLVQSADAARQFASDHGFPLIVKPDTGVGARGAFKVDNALELEEALLSIGSGYVIEEYLQGQLISFDGLVDDSGHIAFFSSHVFNDGIMHVVTTRGPMHYYSLRELPEDLERTGREVVKAFNIRGRFFHIEFFRLADGSLRALEVNVRPPGGFTTDMMNFSADIDVFKMWAEIVTGRYQLAAVERKYHVAHVSRRHHLRYAVPHEELLRRLEGVLLMHMPMPEGLSGAMGDYVYMLRATKLAVIQEAIADVERQAD